MNREEIKQHIPHREPMLLIDEVWMDPDGTGHGRYRIREDEFFCQGHFPGNPIVPGVILVESMAQVCIASLVSGGAYGDVPPAFYLAAVENVRFLRPVRPGDTFVTRASNGKCRGRFLSFDVEGFVNGDRVVKATLKCFSDRAAGTAP